MKQLQIRNPQNVDLLRPDFQHRSEPNFAWRAACSMFLALPGLRGFWPMSSIDYTAANRAIDESGQGNHLTDNNTVEFGYDSLAPYVHMTLANSEYLSRADGGAGNWADIIGTETYIESAYRGLTTGGWFYFDNAPGANQEECISKATGGTPALTAYRLVRRPAGAGGDIIFTTSDGATGDTIGTSVSVPANEWHFLVGRFIPSTEMSVFDNGIESILAVGINANIQDIGAPFQIGARGDNSRHIDGRASMCFLCATQLSDGIILSLFEQTKAMYGVS